MNEYLSQLLDRIEARDAHVAVIGLGYVGLPLAVVFAEAGYRVTGIDVDARKVDAVNAADSYIDDIPSARLRSLVGEGRLTATTDYAVLRSCDAVSICVPT